MKTRSIIISLLAILLALTLGGCAATESAASQPGGIMTGVGIDEQTAGRRELFSLEVARDGDPLTVDFRGSFQKGVALLVLENVNDEIAYSRPAKGTSFNYLDFENLPAGSYRFALTWKEPVQGTYSLEWYPEKVDLPQITPVVLLPGVGMTLVGLAFWILGVRRGGWKYALWGALFWVGTVALKFGWAIAENARIYDAITKTLAGAGGTLVTSLYIGVLTGLTEVLITWIVLRYTRLGKANWKQAFAFGVGFGAVEALLLGMSSLISMITVLSMPGQIPVSAMRSVAVANNVLYSLAPVSERFFTIWVHILCNVLLFYGAATRSSRWFWASFVFKSLLDTVAGYSQLSGRLDQVAFIWSIEAVVILFGVVAWIWTRRIEAQYPSAQEKVLPNVETGEILSS